MLRPYHCVVLAAAIAAGVFAQTADSALQFEVASLKPSAPNQQGGQVSPRAGNKTYAGTNMTLRQYMSVAYQVRDNQIVGGPSWMDSDRFDFEGHAEKPSTQDELHAMLQHLIEERFQMKIHRESREKSGFAIVVDKGGPKALAEHDRADLTMQPMRFTGPGKFAGINADMRLLALNLSRFLDLPVVDKTGLTARYDFTIQFPPLDGDGAPRSGPPDASVFSAAMRDSIGLRLEPAKLSAEFIVIERIQKLTAN
jgi:uncharacterized protein (TIGR03435 family)